VYAHGLISGIIGFYGSLTGLYPKLPKDQPTPGPNDVQDGSTTGPKTYQNFSIGMTCKAVENFYFYAGFSLGDYKQNVVTLYRNSNGQFYNITTQTHGADRGFDFGAIYYAGKKVPRFGIQMGFNTTTKSIVGGIQIALFTRKVEW